MVFSYSKELLGYSKGHWQKLMAVWDGLNIETQIEILDQVATLEGDDRSKHDLCKQALKSSNTYVRYAAAKWIISHINNSSFVAKYEVEAEKLVKSIDTNKASERDELLNLIRNDKSDLVRYSEYEVEDTFYLGSRLQMGFWKLPQKARLALMRSRKDRSHASSDVLLHLVTEAQELIENNSLAWEEVDEVLTEFAYNAFGDESWHTKDYYSIYDLDYRLRDLWEIIPLLKDYYAEEYLKRIPYVENAWVNFEKIMRQCSDRQLEIILNREDVKLVEIRKELFFDEKIKDGVKWAAIHFHFYPTYEEFQQILDRYNQKIKISNRDYTKIQLLGDIGTGCTSLSLCMYQAILTLLEDERNQDEWVAQNLEIINLHMENKIKSTNVYQREKEITDLRLFQLSSHVYDRSDYFYDDSIAFLAIRVVQGDCWKTFMAFAAVWAKYRPEEVSKKISGSRKILI